MIKYGIIGAGWRSEFYIRIATLLPETFRVSGIYIRNSKTVQKFSVEYSVPIFSTLEELLDTDFDFLVSCVNKASICDMITTICSRGFPLLSETPIGINDMQRESFFKKLQPKWRVQVAEQFPFQPRNMAIKKIIESGILGDVHQVQLSSCHDYHAASLIRFFLNTGDEVPQIETLSIPDHVARYNSRAGLMEPVVIECEQKLVLLRFQNKTALYDFNFEQYFSDIRTTRILVRGTLGEIVDNKCTYLKDGLPHSFTLDRNVMGTNENLDGFALRNITGNGEVWYQNPFPYVRMSDEEIAIATCLIKMSEYIKNATEFYSVNSAAFDASLFFFN